VNKKQDTRQPSRWQVVVVVVVAAAAPVSMGDI
jgi:hypothetical protein